MNPVVWTFPTRILFGEGAIQRIGLEAHRLGGSRALVVTDPGVVAVRLVDTVMAALEEAGVVTSLFTEVKENPREASVHAGVAALRAKHADLVVAVGGGSVLDVAKLIRMRALPDVHERPLLDYDEAIGGERHISPRMPAMIAVPTTAGTGSEVSRSAVVTLEANRRKTVISSPYLQPSVAILDPKMTIGLPPRLTATTGFDALSHCIEAYLALGDHPLCDAIALGGLRLLAESLQRAYHAPADLQARGAMLKAAMMGAVALQKGLGAGQALAHPLANDRGIQQGLAKALCLPAVVSFNAVAVPERIQAVAGALGVEDLGEGLRKLRRELDLPHGLREVGVAEGDLADLATRAAEDASIRTNPRPCGREELLDMYLSSLLIWHHPVSPEVLGAL
ncbi:MAG: iron-containing alcohol dehydrogenase [Myxococcales bacterium]|nr:iron-containing alcohol dehydrogenase [Polyangiaceae bacterium]MDW8251979.1 iron-containing alcohol dehydrogenase [Myxococcales bacterium]